ncbi:hypothetical protein O0I10_007448 [Lichtheimia ornata]|uniref:Uncharacterized protein n=1 Tax=Lichtheimia ornata TaxID=688661 RepID=A0AAD7V1L7_9FUNG|nr:uncharacterized protein O0I10_007448 [Lichtheimia ornata]KAJ8656851.1 hypothetical protein O0I10_007448 [Lichtheimia ornata]
MTASENQKVAVITGGSRGIGKAVAEALVAQGIRVVIGDILDDDGHQTAQELNRQCAGDSQMVAYIHTDVTLYKDVIALFRFAEATFGGVDIAFLNAGIISGADNVFLPLEDEVEVNLPKVNITGVVKCTKVAVLHMAKRGGGVIVNTASVAGFLSSMQLAHYFATKHAVVGWTRSMEMLKDICNVRVNAVCPHWVATDMQGMILNKEGDDPYKQLVEHSPRVKMETVVRGVMMLIEDEKRNAETLLTLPGDVIRVQERIAEYEELSTPEYAALVDSYQPQVLEHYKKQLEHALDRYGL